MASDLQKRHTETVGSEGSSGDVGALQAVLVRRAVKNGPDLRESPSAERLQWCILGFPLHRKRENGEILFHHKHLVNFGEV
jgi:hypothetical protein